MESIISSKVASGDGGLVASGLNNVVGLLFVFAYAIMIL